MFSYRHSSIDITSTFINFIKKLFISFLILTVLLVINIKDACSQISITGSNTKDGAYTSLTKASGAFSALNSISQSGRTIVITITADVTTEDGTFALTGALGMWTSLTINPSGGAARTISGSMAKPLIDIDGADNVTIDGLNTGGNSLILSNTSTSASAGTSTIRFINDANSNTIRNCTIKGSTTDASSGILFFSTTTGSTGNDGNTIEYNNITCSTDANRPLNVIYSLGTSFYENSGNTVSNNNIYNFLSRSTASFGINLGSNTTAWTISTNSFYETASFVPTASVAYSCISISNTSGINFTISSNYIGGSSANCGSAGSVASWTKTNAFDNIFYGINLSVGIATASSIQGNTIKNFIYSNSSSANWYAIYVTFGSINIGTISANTIGATTGTGSITLTGGATGTTFYGIYYNSFGTTDIRNNTIGSITVANSATLAGNFYGIYKSNNGTTTISNNIIGSITEANSIYASSSSTSNAQSVYGMYIDGTGLRTISDNIISRLTNGTTNTTVGTLGMMCGINCNAGTYTITNNTVRDFTIANANSSNVAMCGIALISSASAPQTISGNTIFNLSNTYTSFAGNIVGLYYEGPTVASSVSNNFIHSLSVTGASSTTANIYGIKISSGYTSYSNNVISLGGNTKTTIYGIYETGAANNHNYLYFNTVYIGGSLVTGTTNKSYCLYSAVTTNTRIFENNIFVNARSTVSGSSKHFAIYLAYTVNTSLTINYNEYYTSGTGGILGYHTIGAYNAANDKTTIAGWKTATGQDVNSVATNPTFRNAGSTIVSDYTPTSLNSGVAGTGLTVDYAGATRQATPNMGAFEFNNTITWTGNSNNNWSNTANWSSSTEPTLADIVVIPTGRSNYPNITASSEVCHSLTVQSGGSITFSTGGKLTVSSSLVLNNGGTITISGGELEANGKFDYDGALTMTSGTLDINNEIELSATTTETISGGTIECAGDWDGDAEDGGFTPVGGSLTFDGTVDQDFNAGSSTLYNLTLNKAANAVHVISDFTVLNNLTISDGNLDMSTNVYSTVPSGSSVPVPDPASPFPDCTPGNPCAYYLGADATREYLDDPNYEAAKLTVNIPAGDYTGLSIYGIQLTIDNTVLTDENSDLEIYLLPPQTGGATDQAYILSWQQGSGTYGFDNVLFSDVGTPMSSVSGSPLTGNIKPDQGSSYTMVFSDWTGTAIPGNWNIYVIDPSGRTGSAINISAASVIISTYTAYIGGLWENNDVFTPGNSTVVFNTSGTSNIGGTSQTEFYSLTNNKSTTSHILKLNQSITVFNLLTFTTGKIDLNGKNINLSTTGQLANENEDNRIYDGLGGGSIITTGNSLSSNGITFSDIKGLGLSITTRASGNTPGITNISRMHTIISNVTGTGGSIKRSFSITPTVNTTLGATLKMEYYTSELDAQTEANLLLYRKPTAGSWALAGTGGAVNTAGNYIQITGVDAFSDWTASSGQLPLPISLIDFSVVCKSNYQIVSWITASELNCNRFYIETSKDANTWFVIDSVDAAGNSNQMLSYSKEIPYYDGVNYFRLVDVDYDGVKGFSKSYYSDCKNMKDFNFKLFPNPFESETNLLISTENEQSIIISTSDVVGKILKTTEYNLQIGSNLIKLNYSDYSEGIYFIKISVKNGAVLENIKIVKSDNY
ncbi:MAG: T9SS type A sorting domain-containing protein [Bacteroidota bacterium]